MGRNSRLKSRNEREVVSSKENNMLMNLLAFFEEASDGGNQNPTTQIIMWVVAGVLIVGMVLMMIIPQRKQKKRQEEMMSKLGIGSIVTTIGGIVGEVVELDDKHIWLITGTGDNRCTMQFLRQAIHSIAPAPGSAEALAAEEKAKKDADEIDEIK